MSVLKRLWCQILRFARALEGIDDPAGDYMSALGKLERDVQHLKKEMRSHAGR